MNMKKKYTCLCNMDFPCNMVVFLVVQGGHEDQKIVQNNNMSTGSRYVPDTYTNQAVKFYNYQFNFYDF